MMENPAMSNKDTKFVGIQISPISFIDEGVAPLLDLLQGRFGINVLLIGALSWLGLKVGRRISWELEGWPDHGRQEPYPLKGGSYIRSHKEYYRNTFIRDFDNTDPGLTGEDILAMVIPEARRRGMQVYPEVMEPLFKYAGHGSANNVSIPNMPQVLEVDLLGRFGQEPCINNPDYRTWWYSVIEDYCRNYDIDGVMWCNERRSPLDNLLSGQAPNCFCPHCRREAHERGIDVERVKAGFRELYAFVQAARTGQQFVDGTMIEFLRQIYYNPEVLLWERYWVERNKDMDRELYGIVKWCNSDLKFGLNVWNRNHFNPLRKAQWPWAEMAEWSDWVKPITYQHQAGGVYTSEMNALHKSVLRDWTPQELTPIMYKLLGLHEAPWDELIRTGMDPDTYVHGQCADAVAGVNGKVDVYMGIGVDAPRSRADQAACTPDIVRRSVLATYRAGGKGVVFSPAYAGMNLANLDGAAHALTELGLK
jgi:hypothetical protein